MAIIDRVKQRTETDLTDDEIQLIIDEANNEVIQRYGPHPDPANPITVTLEGDRERLVLARAIDTSEPIVITEFYDWFAIGGETTYVLVPTDYRIIEPYNTTIMRWWGGNSTYPSRRWAHRVDIEYTPVNDGDQREEVIIKIVILTIQYDAFKQQTIGDFSGQTNDYNDERNKLLNTLSPRRGLYMA